MELLILSVIVSAGSVGVMWIYMCRVSAERNGWDRLAEHYRAQGSPDGVRFGLQSAIFNGFAFTGTLHLGVEREGLYLRGGPLLRLFHPSVVIPWSELRAERFVRGHSSGYTLRFEAFPDMGLELSDAAVGRLSEAIPEDWGVTPPWTRDAEAA